MRTHLADVFAQRRWGAIPVGQFKVRERYVWWSAAMGLAFVALTAISTPFLGWRFRGRPFWPAIVLVALIVALLVTAWLTPLLSWIEDIG